MNSILSLCRYAEKRNIEIVTFPLPETASMSIETESGACSIGLDYSKIESAPDERVHLGHELGHCVTGSFYNRYAKMDIRQKHENRADKWAIRKLIPVEKLDTAVAEGHTELWDLADYFGVTEDFIKKAVCYYVHGNLAVESYM